MSHYKNLNSVVETEQQAHTLLSQLWEEGFLYFTFVKEGNAFRVTFASDRPGTDKHPGFVLLASFSDATFTRNIDLY